MSRPPTRPLEGLRVLDFTRVYSGPYATLLLSDLGAEVIKVEHPEYGDDSRSFGPFINGTSGYFETLNRGKKSIAVDYRTIEGQRMLAQLAQSADVLIENFRPGKMRAYGLDEPALRPTCPRLIYVSISGFGQFGPYSHLGCYDVVAQAMSGLMSMTGLPELPIKTGPAIADAITGLTAAVGLLAALYQRERTGQGTHIDIAMLDSVFATLENSLAATSITGESPARAANADAVLAPFDSFPTHDGWVVIGVGNDRLWRRLAALIDPALVEDARFATNTGRVMHYAVLRPIVAGWCSAYTSDALLAHLHAADIPAGAVRSMDELLHDPHLEARDMLLKLSSGVLVPGSPIHIAGSVRPTPQRAPLLGEHNADILGSL
ncbi:MAG: CaiB/BaiF CoA-transferase family protein [Anaerolineae bacterium]